jgi:hypothetical protein
MFRKLFIWLKLAPSTSDLALKDLISKSYNSIEVVGRGTINLDPVEVTSTDEWKLARQQAKEIVSKNY